MTAYRKSKLLGFLVLFCFRAPEHWARGDGDYTRCLAVSKMQAHEVKRLWERWRPAAAPGVLGKEEERL